MVFTECIICFAPSQIQKIISKTIMSGTICICIHTHLYIKIKWSPFILNFVPVHVLTMYTYIYIHMDMDTYICVWLATWMYMCVSVHIYLIVIHAQVKTSKWAQGYKVKYQSSSKPCPQSPSSSPQRWPQWNFLCFFQRYSTYSTWACVYTEYTF